MRTVRTALVGATLWGLALVVAALTVPFYSGETQSADSTGAVHTTPTSATLVGANGWWGLVVAGLPLVVSLVVGVLLLGVRRRPAQLAALVVVGLLGIVTLLGMLTVGVFLVPATAALGVAVLVALSNPAPRRQRGGA